MATPAARPLQKRYHAGSCTLDVTFQLSVLSQWHSRPVIEQLAFKLWLQRVEPPGAEPLAEVGQTPSVIASSANPSSANPSPTLVAEGDRTVLRSIAQHLQQQTRATLAIATLNVVSTCDSHSGAAQLPPDCLVQGPLSYLQLCDLTSVLSQYEQATRTLPVALNAAITQPAQTNLVPFPAGRRRPLNRSFKVWASSAAVALFAVGVTTTLWRTTRGSTTRHIAFQKQAPMTAESVLGESDSPSELSAARPRPMPDAMPEKMTHHDAPVTAQETLRTSSGTAAESTSTDTAAGRSAVVGRSREPMTANPAPAAARPAELANIPTSDDSPLGRVEADLPNAVQSPTGPSTSSPSTSPSIGDDALEDTSEDASVDSAIMSPIASAPPSLQVPEAPPERPDIYSSDTNTSDLNASDLNASDTNSSSAVISSERAPSGISQDTFGRELEDDTSELPESADDAMSIRRSPSPNALLSDLSTQEADMIAQIQTYLQARWKPDQRLRESLTYQLQLAATGEVISVAALNSVAQDYRDRLFPSSRALSFSHSLSDATEETALTAELTLLLTLTPEGEVQVSKL